MKTLLEIRGDNKLLFTTFIQRNPNNREELKALLVGIFNMINKEQPVVDVESIDLSRVGTL